MNKKCVCNYCNKKYDNFDPRGSKFCSLSCSNFHRELKKAIKFKFCKQCNKSFKAQGVTLNKIFCNRKCSNLYNIKHKTKGNRRSKLEIWLEQELTKIYPNLDIHYNKKDTIGSELDIYIPSLKLAFELNGIFHYEPIYGKDKLERTQVNDNNKFQKCQELGISLCVIDTSSQKYFKENNSQKFLGIILDILNEF